MRVVTAKEMVCADRMASKEWGLPVSLMMEHAGLGVARCVLREAEPTPESMLLVLAGKGNNGGDALAAARHLVLKNCRVQVLLLASRQDLKEDPRLMLTLLERCGVLVVECTGSKEWTELQPIVDEADLILDGILGTGLKQPVSGWLAEVFEAVNAARAQVFSIDIPSGLSGDTAAVPGPCIEADVTVALGLPKPPLVLPPAVGLTGELHVVGLGVPIESLLASPSRLDLLEAARIRALLPLRPRESHKGDYGHILALVGSRGKPGAGALACLAALRAGAGLVTAAVPASAYAALAAGRPEVMVEPLPETPGGGLARGALEPLRALVKERSVLMVGPGLGMEPETVEVVRALVSETRLPLVLDADGINAFAGESSLLDGSTRDLILTPHPGEMGRLLGSSAAEIQAQRLEVARQVAAARSCHVVLKGYRSLIAAPDGHVDINPTGNAGLATAGSGDVLTGMVAGFLAQGLSTRDALCCAVYLHGLSADLASHDLSEISLVASDVIEYLPEAILRTTRPRHPQQIPGREDAAGSAGP